MKNDTFPTEIYILGFTIQHHIRIVLVIMFSAIYIITCASNSIIIFVVKEERTLHIPMYFFLVMFSFLEVCYISVIFPTIMKVLLTYAAHISSSACFTQLYLFLSLACTENYLLASMAFDRYVAICQPLQYNAIINNKMCIKLSLGSWIAGFITPIVPIFMVSKLMICGSNEVDHFFCDLVPVLRLSCNEDGLTKLVCSIFASAVLLSSCGVTTFSYIQIALAVCKMSKSANLQKMLMTCTSQLIVVAIFYVSGIFSYVILFVFPNFNSQKEISLLYTVGTPLLNPFIYALKNKDVKFAIKKHLCHHIIERHSFFKKIFPEITVFLIGQTIVAESMA